MGCIFDCFRLIFYSFFHFSLLVSYLLLFNFDEVANQISLRASSSFRLLERSQRSNWDQFRVEKLADWDKTATQRLLLQSLTNIPRRWVSTNKYCSQKCKGTRVHIHAAAHAWEKLASVAETSVRALTSVCSGSSYWLRPPHPHTLPSTGFGPEPRSLSSPAEWYML